MLDDLLETFTRGHKRHGHSDSGFSEHGHHGRSDGWSSGHGRHDGHHDRHFTTGLLLGAAQAVKRNKTLLVGFLLVGLVVLALGVWLLVTLVSLSGPLVDFVNQNGLKGLADTALALAQKLWLGAGK